MSHDGEERLCIMVVERAGSIDDAANRMRAALGRRRKPPRGAAWLSWVFGFGENRAYELAKEVDKSGRSLLLTTTREHAELKQEQIHAFGPDPFSSRDCKGSMTAIIEPAY